MKKLTIEFIREAFEGEGYTLVTSEYVNNKQKLEYICPEGHHGNISWGNWQQGRRCAECAGLKKLTIEFVREAFKREGYTLVTTEYVNAHQKLDYICPKGHLESICWGSWLSGARCQKCFFENNKGKNNPRWNPNLTAEDRKRKRPECKIWTKKVYKRDNFTCQICGQIGGKLNAHHLESYASNPELRTELNNGVTLCEKCHRIGPNSFHHVYGNRGNTIEQFIEFIKNLNK